MQLYKEEQKKRGKKNIGQIKSVTGILKEYAGERFTLNQIDSLLPRLYRLYADKLPSQRKTHLGFYA